MPDKREKENAAAQAAWLRARVAKCRPQDLHLHPALLELARKYEALAAS